MRSITRCGVQTDLPALHTTQRWWSQGSSDTQLSNDAPVTQQTRSSRSFLVHLLLTEIGVDIVIFHEVGTALTLIYLLTYECKRKKKNQNDSVCVSQWKRPHPHPPRLL